MNKRELETENDDLREALIEAYNAIESALAALGSGIACNNDDTEGDDEEE